jgi:ABC-type arginine transport system permease subunit
MLVLAKNTIKSFFQNDCSVLKNTALLAILSLTHTTHTTHTTHKLNVEPYYCLTI